MRTLYYNIRVIRSNSGKNFLECGYEYSRSEGFWKIEYDNKNKIRNIEGVLTMDYICSSINGNEITIVYLIPSEKFYYLIEDFRIVLTEDEIEFPLNINLYGDECRIAIQTKSKIKNPNEISMCEELLKEYKYNGTFAKGRK